VTFFLQDGAAHRVLFSVLSPVLFSTLVLSLPWQVMLVDLDNNEIQVSYRVLFSVLFPILLLSLPGR